MQKIMKPGEKENLSLFYKFEGGTVLSWGAA